MTAFFHKNPIMAAKELKTAAVRKLSYLQD